MSDFLKIVGVIVVAIIIIKIALNMFRYQTSMIEGLTNSDSSATSGEGATSASYAAAIKAQMVKLQDELLVSKYRKDYETAIINLDDYMGYLMIKQCLNLNPNNDIKMNIEAINTLNSLKAGKESLNATMTFLDKQ